MFVLYVSAADAAVALVLVVVVVFGSKFRGKRRFFLLGGTTRGCVRCAPSPSLFLREAEQVPDAWR